MREFITKYANQVLEGVNAIEFASLEKALDLIKRTREGGQMVWLCGNGGSATLASHMATDLQLAGVRAMALTDIAAVTTYANDFNYESAFLKQLQKFFQPGDLLIALSGSGNSVNVWQAAHYANTYGNVIGMAGWDGGKLKEVSDVFINVKAKHMGVAQDLEQVVLHMICYYLMEGVKE